MSLTEFFFSLSACANGYDGSLMTSIIAMPHFQQTFGVQKVGTGAAVVFSLYVVYVSQACIS